MKAEIATVKPLVGQSAWKERALNIGLWALQLGLAFMFASGGLMKLAGAPEMVAMFAEIGVGQWLRYVVGALEVAGGIGLLVPRFTGRAALGLVGLMVGATLTNLFILQVNTVISVILLLLSALIAWRRWR